MESDPGTVPDAGAEVDRIAKLGIRAIKIHPSHQALSPNAYMHGNPELAAIYDRAQANDLPIMIHTGTSIFPGARNIHAQPILCDEVAVDYPDLVLILAHGGRPLWMNEAFFLVRRHKNMYMDISGIPPQKLLEYFPRIEEIADKVLWGTDWPSPGVTEMKINVDKFNALPIREDAQAKNSLRQRCSAVSITLREGIAPTPTGSRRYQWRECTGAGLLRPNLARSTRLLLLNFRVNFPLSHNSISRYEFNTP